MLLLLCASCASLPEHSPDDTAVAREPAPLMVPDGSVTGADADRMLAAMAGAKGAGAVALAAAVRQATATPFTIGNRTEPLIDGPETFAHLYQAIAAARHSVHLETYIFADDPLGERFADLLIQQAQRGIEVRVIVDAFGSMQSSAHLFARMRNGNVLVREFRPLKSVWMWPWRYQNRDHRKLVVIDGRTAFTGGVNISGTYASSSRLRPGPKRGVAEAWRDTHLQIEGPAVRLYQAIFLETWVRLGGEVSTNTQEYFPPLPVMGEDAVSAVANDGMRAKDESIYLTYMAAITHARRRIWITQAYFAPPKAMIDALAAAAARGVDVRIVLPGFTDSGLIFYASRQGYAQLLERGVHLHEIRDALLHAKTVVVDDELTIVGSANLDYRSFLHNNEVTAIVFSGQLASRMDEMFKRDLQRSTELTAAGWRKRPVGQRFREAVSGLFRYWL